MSASTAIFKRGKPFSTPGLKAMVTNGLTNEYVPLKRRNAYAGDAAWCPRKTSMLVNLPEDYMVPANASGKFYMRLGSAFHELIQEAFTRNGSLLFKEYRINGLGVRLGGYIDAIVEIAGEPRIVEIKTCGNLPSKPKPEHVTQAFVYSLATCLPNPIIFYMSRSVASFGGELISTEFEVVPTRDELMAVAVNLYKSVLYSEAHMLPDFPSHITKSANCGFCPFTSVCFSDAPNPSEARLPSAEERRVLDDTASGKAQILVDTYYDRENTLRYQQLLMDLSKV